MTTKEWEKSHGHRRPARRSTQQRPRPRAAPGSGSSGGTRLAQPSVARPPPSAAVGPRRGCALQLYVAHSLKHGAHAGGAVEHAIVLVHHRGDRACAEERRAGSEVRGAGRRGEALTRVPHGCTTLASARASVAGAGAGVSMRSTTGRIHGRRIYGRRGTVVVDHQAGCAERQRPRLATIVGPRAYRTSDTLASGARPTRRHAGRRWRSLLA